MQKGLDYLIQKYSVDAKAVINGVCTANIDGLDYPILSWESERRFIELKNLVKNRLGNMSTYRIGCTDKKSKDIFDLLAREIGILEFTLDSKIIEIFAISGENTLNCIAETENGCICTIELATTLSDNDTPVDKHEIITDKGVACDRVVDTQVPQESIYVFGDKKITYTDTDAELFGYTDREISTIRKVFSLSKDKNERNESIIKMSHINKVVESAKKSLATLENVEIK